METCKSVNEDVDANVNENGYDENLAEEEEEEEELDMVIFIVKEILLFSSFGRIHHFYVPLLLQAAADNEKSFDSHGCILQSLALS